MDGVEIDVRYNTRRNVVLCHDREKRNGGEHELFADLCATPTPLRLIVDIKAFGIATAARLARDVANIVARHKHHRYELCSFNEYCVRELMDTKLCSRAYMEPHVYEVGVISSGVSLGMFETLYDIDFVSLNYDVVHEEILEKLRSPRRKPLRIYAWTCNDPEVRWEMGDRYKLDGIIYDIYKNDPVAHLALAGDVPRDVQANQTTDSDPEGVGPQRRVLDLCPVADRHAGKST